MLRATDLRLALLAALAVPAVFAFPAAGCGDDTVAPVPDGAAGGDGSTVDGTVAGDSGAANGGDGSSAADTGCTPYDASQLDGAMVKAGRTLALALKCAKCHGDQLSGNPDGVQSPQTEGGLAYPPNLTPDPVTGLGCWTDDQIQNAFLHGIDDEGQPLCPPMPRFADAGVDASGAADLLAFLRSLPAVSQEVPDTPSCTTGSTGDDGGSGAGDASDGSSASDASDGGVPDTGVAETGAPDTGEADAPGEADAAPGPDGGGD